MEKNKNLQNPKIVVRPETKTLLDTIGNKGDTYDGIIVKLIGAKNTKQTQPKINEMQTQPQNEIQN